MTLFERELPLNASQTSAPQQGGVYPKNLVVMGGKSHDLAQRLCRSSVAVCGYAARRVHWFAI
jgi:hypothetical protein